MEYIIVQAGGKGTRLGYLTKNKPKALVPVENLPMIFHLFRKYPTKRFIIIADYQKEVLREYCFAFADVKYQIVDADGEGTCGGVRQALALMPEGQSFMLVWSDLILPEQLTLPEEYGQGGQAAQDYIGISETFPCRWKFEDGHFKEERSAEHGVAGLFLFTDKAKLKDIPQNGELVRWMQSRKMQFREIGLAGTREFGLLEEYEKLSPEKCRPFNRITIEGNVLTKEPLTDLGEKLSVREESWYREAEKLFCGRTDMDVLPKIFHTYPLKMEYIKGQNVYERDLNVEQKKKVLEKLVGTLQKLHAACQVPADTFSLKEAYFRKTMERLSKVEDLIPFAREKSILINGKSCRNVFFHKRELEKKIDLLGCERFSFIHGDCTFSNIMLRGNGNPVLIDPRGYFGYTELYGDERYDWAKLYYSIVGNYDRFNLKQFHLEITDEEIRLEVESNHWEELEARFFELTGAVEQEIKLLHAVIWLSLTTYAWQDYDSVCGAFYNGLYYLEDVL